MQNQTNSTLPLIFGIIMYIAYAIPLYVLSQKTNRGTPWFSFIPILNLVLMVQVANKPIWWILLFFVPCVNIVMLVITWMAIAEAVNKPSWIGILTIVPFVNLIVPFYLAFA